MDDLAHYIANWTDLPVVNRTAPGGLFTVKTERLGPHAPAPSSAERHYHGREMAALEWFLMMCKPELELSDIELMYHAQTTDLAGLQRSERAVGVRKQ